MKVYIIVVYDTVWSSRSLEIFHSNILPPNMDGDNIFNFFEILLL